MAEQRTFNVPQLLEMILDNLNGREIMSARRVDQTFGNTIAGSLQLQRDINPGQTTAPVWNINASLNNTAPAPLLPGRGAVDLNPAFLRTPREPVLYGEANAGDEPTPDIGSDDDDEENDDSQHDACTRDWPHMASFCLDEQAYRSPAYVEFTRKTTNFSNPSRTTTPSYNDLFVTIDPQVPIKITIENAGPSYTVGFDWKKISIVTLGANLGQLLHISELLAGLARDRQERIEADDDAYDDMLTDLVDSLRPELQWKPSLRNARVYQFIRRRNDDPVDERGAPKITWMGVSADFDASG